MRKDPRIDSTCRPLKRVSPPGSEHQIVDPLTAPHQHRDGLGLVGFGGDGRKLFAEKCAACHGNDGAGGGDPGRAVSPSPALLAYMIRRPIAVDEYLMWAISDGGKQFDSEMPAFKDALARDDIWRIIAYMRAGFPESSASPINK